MGPALYCGILRTARRCPRDHHRDGRGGIARRTAGGNLADLHRSQSRPCREGFGQKDHPRSCWPRRITRENEIMMLAALGDPKLAIEAAHSVLDKQQDLQAWFLFTPITRNVRQDPG